jgi:hypothetical protein
MAEPVQPATPAEGWTPGQLKQLVDEKIAEVQRAVDVAREGIPPHVTIQDYFEMLLNEREKAVQLALTSADKLEQERLARNADLVDCERRVSELTRQLSQTAIDKAEDAANKRFEEQANAVKEQVNGLTEAVRGLTERMDRLAG